MTANSASPRSSTSIRAAAQPLRGGPTKPFEAMQPILALQFDAMRRSYAGAVVAGLVPRSMLASARFDRWLGALEALTLGPLARWR